LVSRFELFWTVICPHCKHSNVTEIVLHIKCVVMFVNLLDIMVDVIIAVRSVIWNKYPPWTRKRKVLNMDQEGERKFWIYTYMLPSHSRLLVTGSQKWATHMHKEEAIMSKYSHVHWSAIACAKSCEKSQCKTKSLESASTPWITRRWLSYVILSSWVHELFGCLRHKVFEEFSDCTFFLHPTLF